MPTVAVIIVVLLSLAEAAGTPADDLRNPVELVDAGFGGHPLFPSWSRRGCFENCPGGVCIDGHCFSRDFHRSTQSLGQVAALRGESGDQSRGNDLSMLDPRTSFQTTGPFESSASDEIEKLRKAVDPRESGLHQDLGALPRMQKVPRSFTQSPSFPVQLPFVKASAAEAVAKQLADENSRLRQQLVNWHLAGEKVIEFQSKPNHLLNDGSAGLPEKQQNTNAENLHAPLPSSGVRRRRRTPVHRKTIATALLNLVDVDTPPPAEGEPGEVQQGSYGPENQPYTQVKNVLESPGTDVLKTKGTVTPAAEDSHDDTGLKALMSSLRGSPRSVPLVALAITSGFVITLFCSLRQKTRPTPKGAKRPGGSSPKGAGGLLTSLMQRAGLAQKTNGYIEVAEMQLGNIDERLVQGGVRVVVKPGGDGNAIRSRAGVPIGGAGDVAGYLSFADVIIVPVEEGDAPVIFSVLDCDGLMDDKIASAVVLAQELLSMARQRRQYFCFDLRVEGRRWNNDYDSGRCLPYLAIRLREVGADVAKASAKAPALQRRSTGLPR